MRQSCLGIMYPPEFCLSILSRIPSCASPSWPHWTLASIPLQIERSQSPMWPNKLPPCLGVECARGWRPPHRPPPPPTNSRPRWPRPGRSCPCAAVFFLLNCFTQSRKTNRSEWWGANPFLPHPLSRSGLHWVVWFLFCNFCFSVCLFALAEFNADDCPTKRIFDFPGHLF